MNSLKIVFIFLLSYFSVLKSAEFAAYPSDLNYYVQEEDIEGISVKLKEAPQDEKDKALCLACRVRTRDDLTKKQVIIHKLIESGASLSFEHNGQTPLDIIKHHGVWYRQQGVLTQLTRLVTPDDEK